MSPAARPRIGFSKHCFICGQENPHGLRARFEVLAEGRARSVIHAPPHVQGFEGILHGGIIAALCDEVMWYAGFGRGLFTVTGEMRIRYRSPVPMAEPVHAEGWVTEARHRLVRTQAELRSPAGAPLVLAEARFFVVPSEDRLGEEEIRLYDLPCPGNQRGTAPGASSASSI